MLADAFEVWNRKLHFYIGLYLLFFLWLFAFSGLLLNHPGWSFAEFWPNRKQSAFEAKIVPPAGSDLEQARNIMRQLGIRGEVDWTTTRTDPARFGFRAIRPGHMFEIAADYQTNRATVQRTQINTWGIMHVLHTFTALRMADNRNTRDWAVTTLWVISMDAVAAGLIFMVFSSYYMWYKLRQKRLFGLVALGLGVICCGVFVFGLRLLT